MLMKTGLVNASIGCIMSTVEEGESRNWHELYLTSD